MQMFGEFGDSINPYALDYPVCTEKDEDGSMRTSLTASPSVATSSQALHLLHHTKGGPPFLPDEDKYHPCEESHLLKYLNRWDVQVALHANVGVQWEMCTTAIKYSRVDVAIPQIALYKELVEMGVRNEHSLNMFVYSGDDDSICSTAGTQEWIYDLGVAPMDGHLWKAWKVEQQTAGFVTHFDLGETTDATFTFATVHGAGHEVPAYRPMEALLMFKMYLRGEW
jgi:carboxypeptidase C (cathepsin A)